MANIWKQTTRLTGLAVSKHPHSELLVLYGKILRLLDTFPKNYAYRQYTENLIKERQQIVKQEKDIPVLEEKIGCGQVEELISQAKNELLLVEKMQVWRPWESLMQTAPQHQWSWPPHK